MNGPRRRDPTIVPTVIIERRHSAPHPPPSVPTDAVRDLEAVAAQLAETARDMQAAGLMVGTVIERLRAGGGSGA